MQSHKFKGIFLTFNTFSKEKDIILSILTKFIAIISLHCSLSISSFEILLFDLIYKVFLIA